MTYPQPTSRTQASTPASPWSRRVAVTTAMAATTVAVALAVHTAAATAGATALYATTVTAVVTLTVAVFGVRNVALFYRGHEAGGSGLVLEALIVAVFVATVFTGHAGHALAVLFGWAVVDACVSFDPAGFARSLGRARRAAGIHTRSEIEAMVWQSAADRTRRRVTDPSLDAASAARLGAELTRDFTLAAAEAAGDEPKPDAWPLVGPR